MTEKKETVSGKVRANRILWISVAVVLCLGALIAGIAASIAGGRGTTPPTTTPPVTTAPPTEGPDTDAGVTPAPVVLSAPLSGAVSKGHDLSLPVYSATLDEFRVHSGIDILSALGTTVTAAADGTVSKIESDPLLGVSVSVDHGEGTVSVYRNLSAELAEGLAVGSTVTRGQALGTVGETAMIECADEAHLHFEVYSNGNAVDPLDYISEESIESSLSGDTFYEG